MQEWKATLDLPSSGSFLVVGPPGSGKTLLAVCRAATFATEGKQSLFLVFNQTLRQYLQQVLVETGLTSIAMTFHQWFFNWYKSNFNRPPPHKDRWSFDWQAIYRQIGTKTEYLQFEHIVIDEGQDFPPEFYFLLRLLSKNITVFADENQRITQYNSTLEDIRRSLGLKPAQIIRLSKNYRNTRPIAEFASTFYAGLRSGIADMPVKDGPRPRLLLAADFQKQVDYIAHYERSHPDKDIAVFMATIEGQVNISRSLARCGTTNPTQMYLYKGQKHKQVDFRQHGIRILSYASAKGLEFDTVFLPELDTRVTDPDSDFEKMRFYVLCSRAREELFLLAKGNSPPPLLHRVPRLLLTVEHIE
jgi:superfamily I DNA/RNA helicase